MVDINNAQKYLDEEIKKTEEVINLTELLYNKDENKLKYAEEGELKIDGFENLKEIKIDMIGEGEEDYVKFEKVTKITIANCPKLEKVEIHTFTDSKEAIINNCPELTELDCSHSKLGKLTLNNCSKLEVLDCNTNELKDLDIHNLSNIVDLYCQKNSLTNIILPKEANKLEILDLSKNKLSDLSFLNKLSLTKLKTLYLDENKLSHSLENLEEAKIPRLKEIGITKTNISLDLSNLPNDLEKIYCDNSQSLHDNKQPLQERKIELCKRWDNEEEEEKKEEYYDHQTWKKLVNAQGWLNYHYPKDGKVKGNHRKSTIIKKREKITKTTELKISNKWLWGDLKLEQFEYLKKLDCSNNYLTSLDLKDCKELTHLNLSNNRLNNVDFLKNLPKEKKEKLKVLRMSNNEKIPTQTLEFLKEFTGLEELNIEGCPFKGSLESLKDMKNLRKIYISHTNVEKGLEHLPESCKELYCDFRYQDKHRTIEIAKELGKHLEEGDIRHYNLDKWREEKRNGVALVIPLDKLPASKNSIKKFLDNWNDEKVKELKDPKKLEESGRMFSNIETGLKVPSIIGGILSLADYSRIGGAMSVASPVAEFVIEQWRKKQYEEDKQKWDNFVQDSESIWDTYWELEETFKFIEPYSSMGKVNEALTNLKKKIDVFLKEHEENDSELNHDNVPEINDSVRKSQFSRYLWKHYGEKLPELKEIRLAIKNLQGEVSSYRQSFFGKEDIKNEKKPCEEVENITSMTEINQEGTSDNFQQQITNDKGKTKETNEYEAQQLQEVKVYNYGSIGSSKK